ncbi:MAG: sugar-binding protein [Planctomycetota bacterium]
MRVMLALLAMLLCACGGGGARHNHLVFAGVPKMTNNPVFEVAHRGAEQACKELGVELRWDGPTRGDAMQQANIVRAFIDQRVDGLLISVNNADVLRSAIDEAVDAHIPVVIFDSDAPRSKRFTFYGVFDEEAGGKGGELLLQAMGKRGKVAILHGTQGATNLEARIRGFRAYVSEHAPEVQCLEPVFCDDNIAKAVEVMKTTIQAHPDLTGFYLSGGWPLFAPAPGPFEGLEPGKIKVVAFDALPQQLDYVRQGYVQALTGQKLFEWGAESVKMLKQYLDGKRDFPAKINSGFDVVTKDNVEQYAAAKARFFQ